MGLVGDEGEIKTKAYAQRKTQAQKETGKIQVASLEFHPLSFWNTDSPGVTALLS